MIGVIAPIAPWAFGFFAPGLVTLTIQGLVKDYDQFNTCYWGA